MYNPGERVLKINDQSKWVPRASGPSSPSITCRIRGTNPAMSLWGGLLQFTSQKFNSLRFMYVCMHACIKLLSSGSMPAICLLP